MMLSNKLLMEKNQLEFLFNKTEAKDPCHSVEEMPMVVISWLKADK
jgi:hypothetical protein